MNVSDTIRQQIWYFPGLFQNRTQVLEQLFAAPDRDSWKQGELHGTDMDYELHEQVSPHYTDPVRYVAARANKELEEWLDDRTTIRRVSDGNGNVAQAWVEDTKPRHSNRSLFYFAGYADPEDPMANVYSIEYLREMAVQDCAQTKQLRDNIEHYVAKPGPLHAQVWDPKSNSWNLKGLGSTFGLSDSEREGVRPLRDGCPLMTIPDDATTDWLDAAAEFANKVIELKGWSDPRICQGGHAEQIAQNLAVAQAALARVAELKAQR